MKVITIHDLKLWVHMNDSDINVAQLEDCILGTMSPSLMYFFTTLIRLRLL